MSTTNIWRWSVALTLLLYCLLSVSYFLYHMGDKHRRPTRLRRMLEAPLVPGLMVSVVLGMILIGGPARVLHYLHTRYRIRFPKKG